MDRAIRIVFILLILTGLLTTVALADNVPVRILMGGREAPVVPPAVFDGKQVLAPLSLISTLGGSYIASKEGGKITVMAENKTSAELEYLDIDGKHMLPVDDILKVIGGESKWDSAAKTLTLISHVQSIEYVDNTLKVRCSFPVSYKAHYWTDKLVLDIDCARIGTEAKEVFVDTPEVWRARLGEPDADTARVTLDLKRLTGYRFDCAPVASKIMVKIGDNETGAQVSMPEAGPVGEIRIDTIDSNQFSVVISTAGKIKISADNGVRPPQIVLNLAGVTLNSSGEFTGKHPLLKSMKCSSNSGKSRVELNLCRAMVPEVNVRDGVTVVNIRTPDKSGGTLANKLIVIDPGHGGKDAGAHRESVQEKDLVLSIAKELSAALEKAGARTMLTRSSDSFIDLGPRPQVALDNGADFFISIHCNSTGLKDSTARGVETYYHMSEPSGQALAYCVQSSIIASTGMTDRKAVSDRIGSKIGWAVLRGLRNSGIPGLLIESGFVNNKSDRARLLDPDYRKQFAAAIVTGLKAYVEGTPLD